MVVRVAEYLGQRTDSSIDITPVPLDKHNPPLCPFMDRSCDKAAKGLPPVCAVRKENHQVWIVCEHRLCSTRTKKKIIEQGQIKEVATQLVPHQINILRQIAHTIYPNVAQTGFQHIGVRREVAIKLKQVDIAYSADYVMRNFAAQTGEPDRVILEMQGGGETSSTGAITRHLELWSRSIPPSNTTLSQRLAANTIETNAWRRQQEQFIVKGNVAEKSDARMVFAVGAPLFDYLKKRFVSQNIEVDDGSWTLCLIAFGEQDPPQPFPHDHRIYRYPPNPLAIGIDHERILFTKYADFLAVLTQQGEPCPEIFEDARFNLRIHPHQSN